MVYFTPTGDYPTAFEAEERLSVVRKRLDRCFALDHTLFPDNVVEEAVPPLLDHRGRLIREGGGLQVLLPAPFHLPLSLGTIPLGGAR